MNLKSNILCIFLFIFQTEALSSDEDEIDEFAPDYLEQIAEFSKTKAAEAGIEMKAVIKDDDEESDDEEEDSIDDLNETALEGFTTPLDEEEDENAIDEYVTFKEVISGKYYKQTKEKCNQI